MMVGGDIGEVKAASGRARRCRGSSSTNFRLHRTIRTARIFEDVSLEVRVARSSALPVSPATVRMSCSPRCPASACQRARDAIVIDGNAAGLLDVTERRRMGAAFVPEERLGHGTAPRMKLSENALLTGHAASGMVKRGFIDKHATLAHVDRTTKTFDVRKAKRDPEAVSLSGGNLQKFVVGREILREPGVLIVSQPTWGVDAGAAATIRQALIDLAARGTAVLVISQDLDELAEIADRIAVMFHGRLSAPLRQPRPRARSLDC